MNDIIDKDKAPLYGRLLGVTVDLVISHMRTHGPAGGVEVICQGPPPPPPPPPGGPPEPPPDGPAAPPPGAAPAAPEGHSDNQTNQYGSDAESRGSRKELSKILPRRRRDDAAAQPSVPRWWSCRRLQERWTGGPHASLNVFCGDDGNSNYWATHAQDAGGVDDGICSDNYFGIQSTGPCGAWRSKSCLRRSLQQGFASAAHGFPKIGQTRRKNESARCG